MEYNILNVFFIIQTAILIGILFINLKMVKEIKNMKLNSFKPLPSHSLKTNMIHPLKIKSVNLNEIIKIDKEGQQEHIFVFVNPNCKACKDLFSNTEIDQSMREKLIVVTEKRDNMDFYDNLLTNKGIPIIESKELGNQLGIKAFPTVVHVDKNLKVKEFFVGSNFVKFKEYIQSA